jgi:hypothetical protein
MIYVSYHSGNDYFSLLELKTIRIKKSLFDNPGNIGIFYRGSNPLLIIYLLINLMLVNMHALSNPNPNLKAFGQKLAQLNPNHQPNHLRHATMRNSRCKQNLNPTILNGTPLVRNYI